MEVLVEGGQSLESGVGYDPKPPPLALPPRPRLSSPFTGIASGRAGDWIGRAPREGGREGTSIQTCDRRVGVSPSTDLRLARGAIGLGVGLCLIGIGELSSESEAVVEVSTSVSESRVIAARVGLVGGVGAGLAAEPEGLGPAERWEGCLVEL